MTNNKTDIKELSYDQLSQWLEAHQIKPYRAKQIHKWIYLYQTDSFEEMTNLGKNFRELLHKHFTIKRLETETIAKSNDGTEKHLFRLYDNTFSECVLIPGKKYYTICVSTQVGCAQKCSFCMTAKGGFTRNLTCGEIINQVRDIQHYVLQKTKNNPKPLSNIVFMGMGEPFANYNNVLKALKVITDSDFGLKFSNRKITLSTCGIVSKFADFGRDSKAGLAISLNATDNKTRTMLMPINDKYPIETLLEACRNYPLKHREKITFEYILIKGINDSIEDAKRLVKMLKPIQAKINIIPFNEYPDSNFKRPSDAVIENFLKHLLDSNYTAIIRKSKGGDISAACGQLSANQLCKRNFLNCSTEPPTPFVIPPPQGVVI